MSKSKPQTFPDTVAYNLPKTGCDSHAHLIFPDSIGDLDVILKRAEETGLSNIGQIFLSPERYYETRELFAPYPQVFFTIGIHPNDVLTKYKENTIDTLRTIVKEDSNMKAIGETGLDFFKNEVPPALQEQAFRDQLILAKECALPVVIHSRDAFSETVRILDDLDFSDYPLIWHCFCGIREQIDILNERGWYISVPGAITYPANKQEREDLKYIPADKLLIETDAPFLSPQGWRGKRNESCLVAVTAAKIAECREVPLATLWTQSGNNARKVFRL